MESREQYEKGYLAGYLKALEEIGTLIYEEAVRTEIGTGAGAGYFRGLNRAMEIIREEEKKQ